MPLVPLRGEVPGGHAHEGSETFVARRAEWLVCARGCFTLGSCPPSRTLRGPCVCRLTDSKKSLGGCGGAIAMKVVLSNALLVVAVGANALLVVAFEA